uniref:Uncharacterized protein n=1 Tax=Chenopodium quinoa TaxID=63459 RepID=A0A803LBS3_CHEQI
MSSTAVLSRLSTIRGRCKSIPTIANLFKSTTPSPVSSSTKRIPRISRLPVEASCLLTMLPLHSAIASARLQSVLSVDSQNWCLVPQALSLNQHHPMATHLPCQSLFCRGRVFTGWGLWDVGGFLGGEFQDEGGFLGGEFQDEGGFLGGEFQDGGGFLGHSRPFGK